MAGDTTLARWCIRGGGFGVTVALAVGVLVVARRRGWAAAGRKWLTALAPLMPSLAVGVTVLVVDGVMLVGLQFPAVLVAVLVALCLAAVPVLVTRIERPALWAVLAWGLPLLGGGIAPFVGVLVVDR